MLFTLSRMTQVIYDINTPKRMHRDEYLINMNKITVTSSAVTLQWSLGFLENLHRDSLHLPIFKR